MMELQTVYFKFRKPPPPPEKLWIQKPAWVSLIVTLVVIFVLGPVGAIYNGLSEDMKGMKAEDKQNANAIIQNQLAIKEILTRQEVMIQAPKAVKIETSQPTNTQVKKPVPPEYFEAYMKMTPNSRAGYKAYLHNLNYDVSELP